MKEIVISDELQDFFNKENEPLKELAKEYDTYINNAKDKEIERLNKENTELKDTKTKYFNENRLLEKDNVRLINIIKEVREYIHWRLDNGQDMYITQMRELLEILDKVEKENDIEFDVLKALNTDLDDDVEMG